MNYSRIHYSIELTMTWSKRSMNHNSIVPRVELQNDMFSDRWGVEGHDWTPSVGVGQCLTLQEEEKRIDQGDG